MRQAQGWGPDRRRAAASITFDNLGEAADLEKGRWPADRPIGQHPTVYRQLPELLALLNTARLRATFFVEASNVGIYPDALRAIARHHEIGCHAYRHETWAALPEDRQRSVIERSMGLYRDLGLDVRGFRPPGGGLTTGSLGILRSVGIEYVSPAGYEVGLTDEVAILPFRWDTIDGTYYVPALRRPPATVALSPDEMLNAYRQVVQETVEAGGYVSFIFHLMWLDTPERLAAVGQLIEQLRNDERVWLAPCREVSDFLRYQPATT